MKKGLIVVLSVLVIIILAIAIGGGTLWSHRNTAVTLEEQINAQYHANQSNYDNMWKKFVETAQVTQLQTDQYKQAYLDVITGQTKDSGQIMQMLKMDNPKMDTALYTNIQNEIIAGRNAFDNNQKKISDIIREYNTFIRKCIIMSAITNRKPMDIGQFIVTSDRTQGAFTDKKDDVIDITGKK